jgi:hypothetical protein
MRHTTRIAPVRIVLAATLATVTLSACGQSDSDGADSATEPTSSAPTSEESAPEPGDSASATGGEGATSTGGGAVLVAGDTATTTTTRIISVSNADGQVSTRPVPLEDQAALDDFVSGFGADLGPQVRDAVRETDVPEGQTLMGAVVAVGCDEPTGIELAQTFDGYEVTGIVPKAGVQCIVAVTSVALFLVETP